MEEYLAMLALSPADLTGCRVLDCPGGASSFTAEACALGADAVAADPAYAMAPGDLAVRALDDARRSSDYVSAHADRYEWGLFGTPEAHFAARVAAVGRFAWDVRSHPGRYVPASLPELPFADEEFDVVLSSHLLFAYGDRLDGAFHRDALRELLRVCRPGGSVRLYPLLEYAGAALDGLPALVRELGGDGVDATLVPVSYRFLRGADTALVLRKR
ncbi:class I SAM-dependent methyltransferase [Motilibacter sp. E257]|uniref:Class I SAM-dependent methyltransferase n=1 Tax=Motilibacter deserti TaxID=2714956 RepID=A0ABX0GZ98_9ACTN|nr:class I SAM-dependent methyltransferase [Motilibacter deserti]